MVRSTYSPYSNASAEGFNRTLIDITRTLMLGMKNCRKDMWAEAVKRACFLRNKLISKNCKISGAPDEVIDEKRPNLAF